MRNLRGLDQWRDTSPLVLARYGSFGDATCGVFRVPGSLGVPLLCVASSGEGWDHVSVSAPGRVPAYAEMQCVYRLFFKLDEAAMHLHVPAQDHVNCCEHCLHLWRPQRTPIPRPPARLVGPKR